MNSPKTEWQRSRWPHHACSDHIMGDALENARLDGLGETFANNAGRYGRSLIVASRAHIDVPAAWARERPGASARVEWREQRVEVEALTFRIEIDPYSKGMLLKGRPRSKRL